MPTPEYSSGIWWKSAVCAMNASRMLFDLIISEAVPASST
jgi:hypothetical protein